MKELHEQSVLCNWAKMLHFYCTRIPIGVQTKGNQVQPNLAKKYFIMSPFFNFNFIVIL